MVFGTQSVSAGEEVHVLTAGGTASLERLSVESPFDEDPFLISATATDLQLSQGGLATYSDIVVLPGGHLLLADGSGRGAVRFDEEGEQVDQLFAPGEADRLPSVVAAAFVSPNEPDQFIIGDDAAGMVRLYDSIDDENIFSYTTTQDNQRPRIARAVSMPEKRLGAAFIWPDQSISGVEVISIDDPDDDGVLIRSDADTDATEAVVIDDLHPVRDLMADLDGRLLITSAKAIFIVDSSGDILWQIAIGDHSLLSGEFASARWLPSGLIVAATRQPGQWNQPHINHRVHLVDPEQTEHPVLDSSQSFEAAPLRLEAADGQGGTGTRDYYADAFEFDALSPNQLSVDEGPQIFPESIDAGEAAYLSFALANPAEASISFRRAGFYVAQQACEAIGHPNELHHPLWSETTTQTVAAESSWRLDDQPLQTIDLDAGQWCGQLGLTGRDGQRHWLGEAIDFEIVADPDSEGAVSVEELADFSGADAGDLADVGEPSEAPADDDEGCGCGSASGSTSLPMVVVLAMALMWIRRPRRVQASPIH